MTPSRIAVKFPATPDSAVALELHSVIALFHRFIQRGSVEGLLVDVADYAHVPDGPGIILIGHDVDYAIDRSGGRTGLLTTRKRCGEHPLGDVVRDALRKALIALAAIEADGSTGLHFEPTSFDLYFIDRLATPNTDEAFETVRGEIAPALEKLFGDAGYELARAHARDTRKPLAVAIVARERVDAETLIERLGGRAAARAASAERQSEWDVRAEDLKELRESGAEFVLVDVREPHEYETCNLAGQLIPLGTLGARRGELDRDAHVVVHCHTGERGARAVTALREAGFSNVWNLQGGIRAWIQRIDPSLRDY